MIFNSPVINSIQPKLTIGQPGDKYEKEADAMADQVMRMQVHDKPVQRKCADCEEEDVQMKPLADTISPIIQKQEEEEEMLQMKTSDLFNEGGINLSSKLSQTKGSGSKLPKDTGEKMNRAFGADFGQVNIHTGTEAVQMSQDLGARAFTHGTDIYFNEGEYNPESRNGQHLLAHELTHVTQQTNMVQKEDLDESKTVVNPEVDLGKKIIDEYPEGFNLAVFDGDEKEFLRKAQVWATTFDAIGFTGTDPNASNITFGKALEENADTQEAIIKLAKYLRIAVDKAMKHYSLTLDTEPYKIKNFGFFAHGTEDWCSVNVISSGNNKAFIDALSPYFTNDINMMIYACSVSRGINEKESWVKGTLDSGGEDSLASNVREYLLDNDIKEARVWGHTTVGHVTNNFALRFFDAQSGADAEGQSYLTQYVFSPVDMTLIQLDIVIKLNDNNYDSNAINPDELSNYLDPILRGYFYSCYSKVMKDKKLDGKHLALMAPMEPVKVAEIIKDYWDKTYWPAKEAGLIKKVKEKFKIKKKSKVVSE